MQMFNGSWSFCSIGHRLLARALEEVVVVVVLSSGRAGQLPMVNLRLATIYLLTF